jgi:hypothetical protein
VRDEVIRSVAMPGITGKKYCQELRRVGLFTRLDWQKRDKFPKDYLDAYMEPDKKLQKIFRQRIADEKYKATKRTTRPK